MINNETIKLTPREQQVLDVLMERGCTNKQIGKFLHIAETTVKLHMSSILKKHSLRTRSQLILFAKNTVN